MRLEKPWQCTKGTRASTITHALPQSLRTQYPWSATKPWQDLIARPMPSRTLIMSTSIRYSARTILKQRWTCRLSHSSPRTLLARLSYLESRTRSVRSNWVSFSMLTTLVVVAILSKAVVEIIQRPTITQSPINRLSNNNSSCFNNSRGSTTCR